MRVIAAISLSSADRMGIAFIALHVMRGLDPRIHSLREMMDCRVKPGNDQP
jgi:hypothetical protein